MVRAISSVIPIAMAGAVVFSAALVVAPARADTAMPCPVVPGTATPPKAAIDALAAHYGPKPIKVTSSLIILAKDASVGVHTCTPMGSTTPMSWVGVLPDGVPSGWEILVIQGKRTTIAAVAQVNGRWRVVATATSLFVPFEPRIVTGPPATARELRDSAGVMCAWANAASATLAEDVGSKDSALRRKHLVALEATLRKISNVLAKTSSVNPGTSMQKLVLAAQKSAQDYANWVHTYLRVVPVATTSMDKKTVAAFGGLVSSRDVFTQRCANIMDAR